MNGSVFLILALLAGSLSAQAEPRQTPREIRVIPKTYVSPGATGSIGGYQRYERHELINGQRLPQLDSHGRIRSSDSQTQQWGGMRQSTEYPGGLRIERLPGSGRTESRERR